MTHRLCGRCERLLAEDVTICPACDGPATPETPRDIEDLLRQTKTLLVLSFLYAGILFPVAYVRARRAGAVYETCGLANEELKRRIEGIRNWSGALLLLWLLAACSAIGYVVQEHL
jgi:hypothetical protein